MPRLDLLSGYAARLNSWRNAAIHSKDKEPHHRQGLHVLSRRLNEANDRGKVAHEMLCQL